MKIARTESFPLTKGLPRIREGQSWEGLGGELLQALPGLLTLAPQPLRTQPGLEPESPVLCSFLSPGCVVFKR